MPTRRAFLGLVPAALLASTVKVSALSAPPPASVWTASQVTSSGPHAARHAPPRGFGTYRHTVHPDGSVTLTRLP